MAETKVYVRRHDYNLHMELTDFESLQIEKRFNDVSGFSLTMNAQSEEAKEVLNLLRQPGGKAGLVVVRDGKVIFSGPFLHRQYSGEFHGSTETRTLTVAGADDTVFLAGRLAVPKNTSGQYDYPFDGEPFSLTINVAEEVMRFFVRRNAADLAPIWRQIPGLGLSASGNKGKIILGRARFDNLLELLQSLALRGGGLGFRVVQTSFSAAQSGNKLEFQVYEPQDKSDWVVFSKKRGNLASFEWTQQAPEANFVIAGGGGSGSSRYFAYSGDEPSRVFYGTWEGFIDKGNVNNPPSSDEKQEIIDSIYEELENKAEKTDLKIETIDIDPIKYGRDYDLGDKVTVEIEDPWGDSESLSDIVKEVKITLDRDGEKIETTIGTAGVGTRLRILDKIRNMEARLGTLEKR